MRILSDKVRTAKKHHPCDACHVWNQAGYGQRDVSADDWLIVEGAQADHWKIKPGDQYREVRYIDGRPVTYRGRLDMDALCQRHELFDDC